MNTPVLALIAVLCNVAAQVAMKWAGRSEQQASGLALWLSPWLFAALALYGLSFVLYVRVLALNPLSVASPAMAGLIVLFIALASHFVFGESLAGLKPLGMVLIVVGIALLSQ